MVDDVKDITETAESKVSAEALDRARLAREKREAEQRKRLDELRAHAAAAQAQREKRDDERRRRQAEQRARDDDRRHQVEERKRAIWEASISRREALLQRERDREERLERSRAARSTSRSAFAFGSSTPRLLEPVDTAGFFWAARRASSTTNVMFASAPLTRRSSQLHLDLSDNDHNKDEQSDRSPQATVWCSVARRRTDLVPTLPASRAPGRAYSMSRLDQLPVTPRNKIRSGETTPTSRPGSAMSSSTTTLGAVRRTPAARRPRPASVAGHPSSESPSTPASVTSSPAVSRDASTDVIRRAGPRRARPLSAHVPSNRAPLLTPEKPEKPGEGKPPLHRKPKLPKDNEKVSRRKSLSVSPARVSSPHASKENSQEKEQVIKKPVVPPRPVETSDVTQKMDNLQIADNITTDKPSEVKTTPIAVDKKKQETNRNEAEPKVTDDIVQSEVVKVNESKEEEKRDADRNDESEMTASMSARRITTEEEAKAALAERRRRAREELEKQAALERERLEREAELEARRQREEEERQRREEEEARELAAMQRAAQEEKLRKAIEAQQQLEREESERKAREEAERITRLKEEESKRVALEEEARQKRIEAEREEKERLARKQRVEAIMARTRLKKAEEDKKQQDNKSEQQSGTTAEQTVTETTSTPQAAVNNGNANTADLLGLASNDSVESKPLVSLETNSVPSQSASVPPEQSANNNGNLTADLLGLSEQIQTEDKIEQVPTPNNKLTNDNITPTQGTNNGNLQPANVGHISANFIQTERLAEEVNQPQKLAENVQTFEDDFTTHNGHGNHNNHPLTLQNAI